MKRAPLSISVVLTVFAAQSVAAAADWPTYRGNNQRTGVSTDRLDTPLSPDWVFTPTHAPRHAWSDPQPKPVEGKLELPRMRFDDAFHVAVAGGRVYFGSSADATVYALDAAKGDILWRFHTEGPVRLAPTVWAGKVYVGSDDGRAYCLDARSGKELWRFSAAPGPERIIGNGRMISVWPVRTGVVVDRGAAYFGAGVWPAEGLYLYAVDAETGKLLWTNDTYANGGQAGITPQGYMVASKQRLFVASGRTMPAAFSRADGRFLFHRNFSWRKIGVFGGTYSVLVGDLLFVGAEQFTAVTENSGHLAFSEGNPAGENVFGHHRLAADDRNIVLLTGMEATCYDREKFTAARIELTRLTTRLMSLKSERDKLRRQVGSRPGLAARLAAFEKRVLVVEQETREITAPLVRWRVFCEHSDSIAIARGMILVGGNGKVVGLDPASGRELWSDTVTGRARGLAVAGDRLLVSVDDGSIHCFVRGLGRARQVKPKVVARPFDKDATRYSAETAGAIVKASGVKRGFGLILGGDGSLALELAKRTDLLIHLVEPDAARAAAAREALSAAGFYGARVVVMQADLKSVPLADYFANLIVCPYRKLGEAQWEVPTPPAELLRMLKPCGGVAYVGTTEQLATHESPIFPEPAKWKAGLTKALADLDEEKTKVVSLGRGGLKITRGPLAGAGSWTHQYAEPGNTGCSDDQAVRGPLGVLWYGQPGPTRMPNRHAGNTAPLAVGGRMFVQAEQVIMAYDAYNGVKLWEREIPGATRLGMRYGSSNFAADGKSLFVAVGRKCHRLDAASGRTLKTYGLPPTRKTSERRWGYVAVAGGTLFGSIAPPVLDWRERETVRGVNKAETLFAVDVETGQLKWTYDGDMRLMSVCIGGGRVYLVDRNITDAQRAAAMKGVDHKPRLNRRGEELPPDARLVVALDAAGGRRLWQRPQYLSDCVESDRWTGEMTVMYADDVLLICGQPWNGHFWREFNAGKFSRRSLIALSAADGSLLWSGHKGYRSRPLIVNGQVITEPWACDLKTGEDRTRIHPLTGRTSKWQMSRPGHHCGNIAAAPNALFFRSGVTAYYDLIGDYGTVHFGAQRPGCWINCIPANGVVMVPEASSGCVCPFAIMSTIVFRPRKTNRAWGKYSAPEPAAPVQHMAINFAAPGDRRASDGRLWLAFPRPGGRGEKSRLVFYFDDRTRARLAPDGRYVSGNADFLKIAGAKDPWIYASRGEGIKSFTLALTDRPRKYTVRLLFAEIENVKPGRRVFDVRLQGKDALTGLDVAKAAGGVRRAVVREFKGVEVTDVLTLEFEAVRGRSLLSGLTVEAED